jgi:hypothetical protein
LPRNFHRYRAFSLRIVPKEIAMRPAVALLLTCLALTACGGTERKTVIVNPPPDSTTVVDRDGNAHVVPNN